MIPAEAVEAACAFVGSGSDRRPNAEYIRQLLEAAAPHMLSHEREQTRLAHLDAMVNRETKQAELAAAWDEGWDTFAGFDSRPGGPYPANPYRPTK